MVVLNFEDYWIAELELGGRDLTGRQVDQLETPRHELELGRAGAAVDHDLARASAGPHALRRDDAAERRQEIVGKVAEEQAPLVLVGDRAERTEEPGTGGAEPGDGRAPE